MKRLVFFCVTYLLLSHSLFASTIPNSNELIYLARLYDFGSDTSSVISYVSKADPCIHVVYQGKDSRYCDNKEKYGLHLDSTYPYAHVREVNLNSDFVTFTYTNPQYDLYCKLNYKNRELNCSENHNNFEQ